MMIENIRASFKEAQEALAGLISNDATLLNIESAAKILIETFENGRRIFSCGNGGSMCDAMHFPEELTGRYRKNRKAYPPIVYLSYNRSSHARCVGLL
jgi:D-sedoheptulose 7-phosphate isomerase